MARIAGVDIPRDKRVVISLTYIYGIGKPTAQQILAAAGVSEDTRVRDLTEDELNRIRVEVDKLKVEGDLKIGEDTTLTAVASTWWVSEDQKECIYIAQEH